MKKNHAYVLFSVILAVICAVMLTVVPAFADEDTDEVIDDAPAMVDLTDGEPVDTVDPNEDAQVAEVVTGEADDAVDTAADSADDGVEVDASAPETTPETLPTNVDLSTLTTESENTNWFGGTSGYIAIAVAVVLLVGAVIAVVLLAPKKIGKNAKK